MVFVAVQNLNAQTPETKPAPRHSYKIDLKLDFDKLAYTGTERVTWVNRGEKPTSVLYFHLYPNLRTGEPINSNNSIETDTDEPQLDIVEARSGVDDRQRHRHGRVAPAGRSVVARGSTWAWR